MFTICVKQSANCVVIYNDNNEPTTNNRLADDNLILKRINASLLKIIMISHRSQQDNFE